MKTPEPKEVREAYSEYMNEWADIRSEGDTDMRYYSGDPWTKEDRATREDAGRPCISLDEISQYINQYNNNLRENKRGIQVIPKGNGANDKDATRRENLIRGIENESNAQEAYITMAEDAVARSYGFLLLRTEFANDLKGDDEPDISDFDQKLVIKRVKDPNTILLNPNYEKADASDIDDGFVLKRIRRSEFARKYPQATKTSFTTYDMKEAKDWISEKDLQIAEWWKVHKTPKKLLLLEGQAGQMTMWESDFKKAGKPEGITVIDDRMVDVKEVIQYLTNGIEILDEIPWAGSRVPIISCFGKELWYDDGGGSKRHLLSMIRLARDPQMLFAYMCTCEAEVAGMVPKTPYIGYEGQFEKSRANWELLNKQPFSFIEVDRILDGSQNVLPVPQRMDLKTDFAGFEQVKESVRRSIQAAMGLVPLSTAAQSDREKSGVAIERIQTQTSIGSFHFTDNYDRALTNLGWQVNELITPIYDTHRELPIEKRDGTFATLHVVGKKSHPIDEAGVYDVQGLPEDGEHLHTGKGKFDVTVETGPSYQSQREQASEFVDHLIANWQQLGIPAPLAQKILALGVKLKDIGPIGDEIQELLNPPTDMSGFPPAAQAAVAQLQSQLQQLQQENQALHMDRAAKVLEQQTKLQVETLKGQHMLDKTTMDFITQIIKAEMAAKSKADAQQAQADATKELAILGFNQDRVSQADDQLHDATMQHSDQAHEVAQSAVDHQRAKELSDQQAQQAAIQQASEAAQGPQPSGAGNVQP